MTRRGRLLGFALALLAAAGGCATFDSWQREAIFQVDKAQVRWHSEPPPGTERFDLTLANGDRVHAWYLPAERDPQDAPTVLYLHGARWNLHNSVLRLARWHELGFNMLAIDYRGFGDSTPQCFRPRPAPSRTCSPPSRS